MSADKKYYFVSYCRQEVTFVDSFSRELTKRGIANWVDFRNLVPGTPWQPQLDDGVNNAEAILLVVSKASMASAPVKDEWTKSLAAGKRIILIIFEPCKLDEGLSNLEWVDFTGEFEEGMKHLAVMLPEPPQKMLSAPPQQGLRLPKEAKKFIRLNGFATFFAAIGAYLTFSTAMGIFNQKVFAQDYDFTKMQNLVLMGMIVSVILLWIPAIWSLFQVAVKVRARTYNAEQIRESINWLAFSNLFLLLFPASDFFGVWGGVEMGVFVGNTIFFSVPLMLIIFALTRSMYRLMTSEPMYRWAGPTGAIIPTVRPQLSEEHKKNQKIKVAIESAPMDKPYARELKAAILKAGHEYTENPEEADVVLPLLSAYKNNSACDPQKKRVIPVLLQSCDVDPNLSQVQWVDLRYGKTSIDALAHLLDKPDVLLKMLGVLPVRTRILPDSIKRILAVTAFLLPVSVFFGLLSLSGILSAALIYFIRKYLMERKLYNLKFLTYGWALGAAILAAVIAMFAEWELPEAAYLLWLLPLMMLPKEVRTWLPAK